MQDTLYNTSRGDTFPATDFASRPMGLLVVRSQAWYREQGKPKGPKQLGIVVDYRTYTDGAGRLWDWPVIRWEGQYVDSTVHPANVVAYRKSQQLPTATYTSPW